MVIRQLSPGDFTGDRLDRYLLQRVSNRIDAPHSERNIRLTYKKRFQISEDATEAIILYGYFLADDRQKGEGRYVFIFERKQPEFWNDLFCTSPDYEITYASICLDEFVIYNGLLFDSCSTEDLDQNGTNEVVLDLKTYFGDRISNSCLILQKDENWKMLVPDFSQLDIEVEKVAGMDKKVVCDEFHFQDLRRDGEVTVLYELPNYGGFRVVENPLWGGVDILYCVPVLEAEHEAFLEMHHSAYIMERLTDHGLYRDTNWNEGKILYVDEKEYALAETINSLWGKQTESGIRFYGNDVG